MKRESKKTPVTDIQKFRFSRGLLRIGATCTGAYVGLLCRPNRMSASLKSSIYGDPIFSV